MHLDGKKIIRSLLNIFLLFLSGWVFANEQRGAKCKRDNQIIDEVMETAFHFESN
jgi:hypothetical protein